MGAFTLTNSALLAGLAVLAAPVIAHLLQRRARRPIVFPSIAFLQATASQHSRLHKLKRLTLLLLRAIAIACVVLAFTRPVWWGSAAGAGQNSAATSTVIVIDSSLSASQLVGGRSMFDQFKASALETLSGLRSGVDLAAVIWASDQPRSIFPRLTANLPALADDISTAECSAGRAEFPAALALANRLLESQAGPRRLVLLTDRQATNWRREDVSSLALTKGVELVVPEFAPTAEGNASLSGFEMTQPRPRPGSEVELTAAVRNHSAESIDCIFEVQWMSPAATQAVDRQSLLLGPDAASRVSVAATAPEQALPAAIARLTRLDALPGDNERWLTGAVGSGLPVVIASDDSPDDPGTSAFYLVRALAPFDDEEATGTSLLTPRHVSASRLSPDDLADCRVLFLGYAGVLKRETCQLLVDFVGRGGSLVVLAGDGPANRNVEALDEAAAGKLVPWRLGSRVEAARRTPTTIAEGRWNTRWLREFDEQSQLGLREVAFRRTWQAAAPVADAETLLTFDDGRPALGVRHWQRGQCIVACFSPEATTSDLGKTGTFVALMQILTTQLAAADRPQSGFIVGDLLRFAVPRGTSGRLMLIGPTGEDSSWETDGGSEVIAGRATRTGVYRLMRGNEVISSVAVNVDARESDLRPLTIEQLRGLLASAESSAPSPSDAQSSAASVPVEGGRPLWGACLLAGIAALALEMLLLGVWRR